jgi:hypothetical protein
MLNVAFEQDTGEEQKFLGDFLSSKMGWRLVKMRNARGHPSISKGHEDMDQVKEFVLKDRSTICEVANMVRISFGRAFWRIII